MRRIFILISLICGSIFLVNANADEQNTRVQHATNNIYAFEVDDESDRLIVEDDADAQTDDDSQVYSNTSYQQYAYSGGKHKRSKHRGEGGWGFPSSRPATGRTVFIFNPNILRWAVYDSSGQLIRTGHGVGGRHYCPDIHRGCRTPSGTFSVHAKMGPGFHSSRYPVGEGGAPMPYAMFFSKYYAIHGSNDVPGYNASHGCIRVYPSDARWLSNNIINYGSTVIVRPY